MHEIQSMEGAAPIGAGILLPGITATAGATVAMATGFGSLVLPSVFAAPLTSEFSWTLGEISLGYAIAAFGMAAGGIFWGRLADIVDLRILLASGSFFLATPLWALSQMTTLWQFHAIHAVLGFLGFGCLFPAVVCGVGAWFPGRRGLVMGIVTAGGAIGQGIMPFAADMLLATFDWRTTYLMLAAVVALAQIVVVSGVRRPIVPAGPGKTGGPTRLSLWKRPRLLALSAAAFFCCACMGVPLIHLAGFVTAICGTPSTGATAMLAAMIAGAAGRIAFGLGADRVGNLRSYLIASAQQTLCLALLPAMQSEASILMVSAMFGFGFAGNMTCLLLCIRDEVPEGNLGAAIGIVMFIAWLGMGVGGYAGGLLVDLAGTYLPGFWLAVAFGVVNLAILALLEQRSDCAAPRYAG